MRYFKLILCVIGCSLSLVSRAAQSGAQNGTGTGLAFRPPAAFSNDFGKYRSPLLFQDGRRVTTPAEWPARRKEILEEWHRIMGPWPALLKEPKLEILQTTNRPEFTEHRIRIQTAAEQFGEGYLLVPAGNGPFPAVLVPFYEPETSVGRGQPQRDFALQLTRRGFVTLSIGSPGVDAWNPNTAGAQCQPLSFLACIAANGHTALARRTEVDPARIGIAGHSYGGKWALFAACLYEKFAAAAWSDPGIVFDETRANVNYWEPWYLGRDPDRTRRPGIPWAQNPRTGAYKTLFESGHDLHELHALMAPRPFLVSGGSEDPPERWRALNHSIAVNALLGFTNRVAMTNRESHDPTAESNEQLCVFFERFLKR